MLLEGDQGWVGVGPGCPISDVWRRGLGPHPMSDVFGGGGKRDWGWARGLYSEVQCIMSNGYMGTPSPIVILIENENCQIQSHEE